MLLRELIDRLKKADQAHTPKIGFANPHSYRGVYQFLAFEPVTGVTVAEMLDSALMALGSTFVGWKGGEFVMYEDTTVYIARLGSTGEELGNVLLAYMLNEEFHWWS